MNGKRFHLISVMVATAILFSDIAYGQLNDKAAAAIPLNGRWGFKLAPQLIEQPINDDQSTIFVSGDHVVKTSDQKISLEGNAKIRRYNNSIQADQIKYNEIKQNTFAQGNVQLNVSGTVFKGPRAYYEINRQYGYMLSPTYQFYPSGAVGQAKYIKIIDNERVDTIDSSYTTCQCENPAWVIKAKKLILDQGENVGRAYFALLYFKNIPVFATPYMTFPLEHKRQSGFLPVTFNFDSHNGLDLTFPYYLNIAPNYDLLMRPRIIKRRGLQYALDYRYLSANYQGASTVEIMPYDRLSKKHNRFSIVLNHRQNLASGLNAYVDFKRVSDDAYETDLRNNTNLLQIGAEALMRQEIGINYNRGPWNILLRRQHWQALSHTNAPYARSPELNINYKKYNVAGFNYGAQANFTRFVTFQNNLPTGQRIYFEPYLSYPIERSSYFLRPKFQAHLLSYNLSIPKLIDGSQPQNLKRKNLSLVVPVSSIDSGLIFERQTAIANQQYLQTLEPRLFYSYTPYVDQSQIPVFDSAATDFSAAGIFTSNNYVGHDRVADGSRLTAGLTSRFIDKTNGEEAARFTVAQQFYLKNQRVNLPNEVLDVSNKSNILLESALKINKRITSQTTLQFNPNNQKLIRFNTGFSYAPGPQKVINLTYRYSKTNLLETADGRINQTILSTQWPINKNWYGVGRINYAVDKRYLLDSTLGFQYDKKCWSVSVALQRYANGLTSDGKPMNKTRILAQIELKGFANIDNGLIRSFQDGITGYTPPPLGIPLSRFANYQ